MWVLGILDKSTDSIGIFVIIFFYNWKLTFPTILSNSCTNFCCFSNQILNKIYISQKSSKIDWFYIFFFWNNEKLNPLPIIVILFSWNLWKPRLFAVRMFFWFIWKAPDFWLKRTVISDFLLSSGDYRWFDLKLHFSIGEPKSSKNDNFVFSGKSNLYPYLRLKIAKSRIFRNTPYFWISWYLKKHKRPLPLL